MHRMPSEWPWEHLIIKSTLYTLSIYPWGLIIGSFRSMTSRFQHTGLWKTGKIGNAPKNYDLEHLKGQKYIV